MSRLVVGPFNRVEGDLEVRIEAEAGQVSSAWVNSPMYRGFEQILHGKDPGDALVYAPRICGICSVSQSVAAAHAVRDALGAEAPPNGERLTNLVLAAENLADHFTHFYLFFMPDFARAAYEGRAWHPDVVRRFRAEQGAAATDAVAARAAFMNLMGVLAGKWPHTHTVQAGGAAKGVTGAEKLRVLSLLGQFRRYLEEHTFGDRLETVAALAGGSDLAAWAAERGPEGSDLARFLRVAEDVGLAELGRSHDRFMSYGSYPFQGERLFPGGVFAGGDLMPLDADAIREDLYSSWMSGAREPVHPYEGVTLPDAEREEAYSWCKAPRLAGRPVEVGALARQVVAGHPLIRELVAETGGNVRNRVVARLLELARVVPAMEAWARAIEPGEPFYREPGALQEGEGAGLVEAARGSLGHWIRVHNGRILNYQIVAPTTWNFSPRDRDGVPGPLEAALEGAPVGADERTPVAVQHVVRSFDPCMVCTVH
ncbi:nickel-dependent hydrogenase large subunit [Thiohalorhabdus methylotrophus]|uniref:Nickel-dependent hydrogenase large subunit n=1 Tax=Thiohalorhabdus methylotrophus TaxID=3242694 RepID=A0ABV4TYC1_9GAMM